MKRLSTMIVLTGFLIKACGIVELSAQNAWTLEECINYALENNINIKRQKIAAEQAENDHQQSKWAMAPALSARGYHSFNFGKTINPDTYEYVNQQFQTQSLQANADITLFDGLENHHTRKMRRYDLLAQLENIEKARYNVTLNIVTYYLNVLSKAEQKKIKQDQIDVTLDQIEKTKEQVEIGNKAKGDLLEIKAQAARERVELTSAQNELKMAYVDLAQLMNLDQIETFKIIMPDDIYIQDRKPIFPADSIYNQGIKTFPTIQNAEYQLKSSQEYLDIMEGRLLPSFTVGTVYYTYFNNLSESSYDEQIKDINPNLNVRLTLSIPIFDRMNKYTQMANASLRVKDSRYQLKEQKQVFFKTIQKAVNEAESAYEDYQANLESVEWNTEAFKYTREKFDVGLVDAVEYKIAKNELARAKSNVVNAKFNYIFRMKILEFYRGQKMEL
jgi:outer membrane protein